MATAVAKKKRGRGRGSEGERGKKKSPLANQHGVYTRPRVMHVAIRSTAKITLDLRVVFDPTQPPEACWRSGFDLAGPGFGSASPCKVDGTPYATEEEAIAGAMQEVVRSLENQAATAYSPAEGKRVAAALADVKSSPWWPAGATNGADTRPGRVEQAASPAAGPRAYRDQAGETGEVVRVVRGLGGVWISARGETGHHHRAKSPKLPPRKTQAEAQRDLDAYAAKRGWQPVDSPNENGSAIVVGPAVPILVPPRLNVNERKSLAKCERVIEGGIKTVFEVGAALLQIRDSRLYRESHESFERYVADRWDFTRQRAYQLIDGAKIREQLAAPTAVGAGRSKKQPLALPSPQNEAQVRPLLKVDEDQRAEVWSKAVERARAESREAPTAAIVAETVREWITPGDELPPRPAPKQAARSVEQAAPSAGCPDPAAWARECDALETRLMQIMVAFEDWPGATAAMVDVLELLIERVEGE